MDNSIRNGIVFENILQHVDVQAAMKLSAVCMRWYEQINNDTVLWNRLVQLEQIEDPEYWYRGDDNDQWTLGTPCKPKNILLNYRRTYYCIKHNIYKKYDFIYEEIPEFEYDGKTLLFNSGTELHIYKIINNNLELFQKIDISVHGIDYPYEDPYYTNSEFIVMYDSNESIMISYILQGNKYVFYNQRSFNEYGNYWDVSHSKLLRTNVLIGTCSNEMISSTLLVWNIAQDRLVFIAPNHVFLKYDKDIVYALEKATNKIVLYNEEFQIIYKINESIRIGISNIIINKNLLHVEYSDVNAFGISTWDKATGQINMGSKSFYFDHYYHECYQILPVNDTVIVICRFKDIPTIECYNAGCQQLWSHTLSNNYKTSAGVCLFNKLLIVTVSERSEECFIEFRDVSNGQFLFSTRLFDNITEFFKDMVIFGPNEDKLTILLYR